ncbi:ABC transporter ATP-binding protein [Aquipuribacter nitratireducens]|uniref:ABC transporter ATP-binding protein n=1 Tax=Aquipuribacter nitratireducens TaxID=650104 RepID=A0ABW0GI58_9MICO
MPDTAAAVVVDGVGRRFRGRRGSGPVVALDGVDLRVHAGEVVALCGPNGAGKTSLLDCVTGMRRPDLGRVRVLGHDPWSADAAGRARTGVVLPDLGLPAAARAAEVLRHHAALHLHPRPVPELLGLLGLDEVRDRGIRRLSTGQRQRLAVACALVGRPDVLVMDEPTAALDPEGRRAVLDVVAAAAAGGTAVLWSSHTLADVERAADRVVVLHRGRVLADGPPSEVTGEEVVRFEAPPGSPTAGLLAALGPGARLEEVVPGRFELRGAGAAEELVSIAAWQAGHGARGGITVGRPSLEDLVLRLADDPGAVPGATPVARPRTTAREPA